jgi:signal transduction histidine kinase/ActR/RegA family two-component response regulator
MTLRATNSERVVVLAPAAHDGPITSALVEKAGFDCALAMDVEGLCGLVEQGAGAVLVAEEALTREATARLRALLEAQEPWSDLPVIVFTAAPGARALRRPALDVLAPAGNVTLLDRPIQVVTLLSAVRAALRARRRQYAARGVVDDLAAAVRGRDQFLALLGHELRNPLAAIVTAGALLERGGDDSRAHAIIARQSRKLSRLVDDLLEVSRVVSGKIALRRAPVDLRVVVDRGIEPIQELADRAGVRIEPELPAEPVVVDADAVRLDQVIGNLLSNSVKYTPRGGEVTVSVEPSDTSAVLRVRDTGIGIPPDMLERIFDTFSQVDSSVSRSEGGLGLGLSLVRGLVALHGGEVYAQSEGPGRGSEFVVELPLAPRGAAVPGPGAIRAPRAGGVARRVLVVEDQEDNREALVKLLEQLGHFVKGAPDGPSGVRAALAIRPDVALVDIGLPGCDGYEVARQVRASLGEGVRLVAVSGYGQAEDRARARAAGFDLHLTKPLDVETLARVLDGGSDARAPGEP